jgi:penicillin-binding protein 1A
MAVLNDGSDDPTELRTPSDRWARARWWLRWAARGGAVASAVLLVLAVVGGIAAFVSYRKYVVHEPGPELDREHIRTIIAQESPVYYRDGTTRVGVFFESEHRLYVPFAEMPRAYVMGLVAAEDGTFWTHRGVNLKGIARAMRDNVLAGSVVSGGSTLTQQTAKNLYYRPDRSLKSKGIELLNALRLEAHFGKGEILEFYVNQFHVTSNGRGLGIASRHFFDKDPDQLNVLESAYLAGLVKGPTNYDPFYGDGSNRERAIERAHERTRYVLGRMLAEPVENLAGPPPDGTPESKGAYEVRLAEAQEVRAEAERLLKDGFTIPFKRGTFRYESSSILDEVARRLAEPPFDEILGHAGIDDARNAGLVVVTTLDADAQRDATYSLWHHLTEVGAWLEQIPVEGFLLENAQAPRFDPDFPPKAHEFRVARVTDKPGPEGKKTIELDLGGHKCLVDRDGVVRASLSSYRGLRKDPYVKIPHTEVNKWLDALPLDGIVLASVREIAADGAVKCDLEVRPKLQGATTVLQQGQVRAMVGGNDNRNFNRATALRQFGSTWKPLVYHAALKLGWSPDDLLDNQRAVFPFSTTFYYPSPDHTPPPAVSLSWAGVNSENVASVWLLYHLLDKLDGEQLRTLASGLRLSQEAGETLPAYQARIEKLGLLSTKDRVDEGLFLQARQETLAGIASARHPEDEVGLRSLLYGWGFAAERNRASKQSSSTRAMKLRALESDWRVLNDKVSNCTFQHSTLADALGRRAAPDPRTVSELTVKVEGSEILVACGTAPEGYVKPDAKWLAKVVWTDVDGTPLQMGEAEDVLVSGRVHISTLSVLSDAFSRRKTAWDLNPTPPELYSPEVLYWHQDFRTLLAMRYIASLAEGYGVQTQIKEVLSMPLGASEITLEEATSLYSGLLTGSAWEFAITREDGTKEELRTATALIQEIRTVDGDVLYRATPTATQVSEPVVGELTQDILWNVVQHGTGQRAKTAIVHGGRPVPVGGKTGTTNDFRNAAFVGFLPLAKPNGYAVAGGYSIGVYVGYDDNRPMESGKIKLAGSSGALPAWIGTVKGLVAANLIGEPPTLALDVNAPYPLLYDPALPRVPVDETTGIPSLEGTASVLVRGAVAPPMAVDVAQVERPPRLAPGTDEALTLAPLDALPPPPADPVARGARAGAGRRDAGRRRDPARAGGGADRAARGGPRRGGPAVRGHPRRGAGPPAVRRSAPPADVQPVACRRKPPSSTRSA